MESRIKIYHVFTGKNFNNFGDMIGPYIYKKIYGCNYTYGIPSDDNSDVYFISGSINEHLDKNVTSFGCGVATEYKSISINKPKKIISVRGPLTYNILTSMGIECPKIYGDTGLLLPKIYNPQNISKKYEVGYIPHCDEYDTFTQKYNHLMSSDDILINICDDIETVINLILQCDSIVSSSLHGCIVAHAYNVPVLSVKLSGILNDFKFRDHYYSIGVYNYVGRTDLTDQNITRKDLLDFIQNTERPSYPLICDIDFLWKIFPLHPNGKINIGFLTDKYIHHIVMDRDFYHMHLALNANDKFNSYYFGPGIDKYPLDWSVPLDQMIKILYGKESYFDVIVSLPGGGIPTSKFNIPKVIRLIHFHETYNDLAIPILLNCDYSIIIFKSPREMTYYMNTYTNMFINKVVKAFPQIPLSKYFNYDNRRKDIDILIVGNSNKNVYPLRNRLFALIRNSNLNNTVYSFAGDLSNTVEDIVHHNKNLDVQEKQEKNYQDHMLRSKIIICTSSKYGYLLKKYIEAAHAKCLVIGNIPQDYYDIMKDVVIDVSDKTDIEIIDTFKYWLSETDKRQRFVDNAYAIITKHFSTENLINVYYEAYIEYKSKFQNKD